MNEEVKDTITVLIEAAREYGADASLETANREMEAEIKLRAELAAALEENERLKRLLSIERDEEGDEP